MTPETQKVTTKPSLAVAEERTGNGLTTPCLSLWQPWAEAMRRRLKKNETRSWSTNYRGYLAIHAAKRRFNPAEYLRPYALKMDCSQLVYGAVVCIVKLVGCETTEFCVKAGISENEQFWGDYTEGRFAWITSSLDMIEIPEPIPTRGRQGLFAWEAPSWIAGKIRGSSI